MRKSLLLLPVITLTIFQSCATLLNSDSQKIFISFDTTVSLKICNDFFYNNSGKETLVPVELDQDYYYFHRSSVPIILTDTIRTGDTIVLKPHRSYFSYWFANIYSTLGLGMLVDNKSNKRFEYPKYNYLIRSGTSLKNIRFEPEHKNSFKFGLGIPYINNFLINTNRELISRTGFWGISLEFDYFLNERHFISANFGAATDIFLPVPAAVDMYGEWESCYGLYCNLKLNRSTPYFAYGFGLSSAYLSWGTHYQEYDPD